METYDPNKRKDEVRQGNERQMNMRVLIISLALIVFVFGLVYFYFFYDAAPLNQQL